MNMNMNIEMRGACDDLWTWIEKYVEFIGDIQYSYCEQEKKMEPIH